jgi:hypothetical protein
MLISLILAHLKRKNQFSWSPSLNFDDREVFSALIPGAQY